MFCPGPAHISLPALFYWDDFIVLYWEMREALIKNFILLIAQSDWASLLHLFRLNNDTVLTPHRFSEAGLSRNNLRSLNSSLLLQIKQFKICSDLPFLSFFLRFLAYPFPNGGNTMSDGTAFQNPKLVVITALITAVTSIGVSVVGIFPQLQARTLKPEKTVSATADNTVEKWSIRGQVVDSVSKTPVQNADVVLVPMTGQNIASTGTDGSFELSAAAKGAYYLVVREPGAGSRVVLPQHREEDGSDILTGQAPDEKYRLKTFINYKIDKRKE
jgi:hypothetical protein